MSEPRNINTATNVSQSAQDRVRSVTITSRNPFVRAAQAQNAFNRTMAENGYKAFTTFYSDLTIAEPFGERAIRDTHRNVTKSWGKDAKYYTEYVMSLNHKIWEHYNNGNERLARVYDDLWRKAAEHAEKTLKGDDLKYYYRTTD